jgi:hypothetical protein
MNRIERVVVDECVGQESPLVGQLRQRLGERPVTFVFLATEDPGIPDIEILDKLLDVRSALLTRDCVLHNLAIGRGINTLGAMSLGRTGESTGCMVSSFLSSIRSEYMHR